MASPIYGKLKTALGSWESGLSCSASQRSLLACSQVLALLGLLLSGWPSLLCSLGHSRTRSLSSAPWYSSPGSPHSHLCTAAAPHPPPRSLTLCAHFSCTVPLTSVAAWYFGAVIPLFFASSLHTHPRALPTLARHHSLTLPASHALPLTLTLPLVLALFTLTLPLTLVLPPCLSSLSCLSSFHPCSPALPPSARPLPHAHRPPCRVPSLSSRAPSLSCPLSLLRSSHMLPHIPSI